MNFLYRLSRFMSGRYGIDKMFYFLFVIAAIISFINIFIHSIFLQLFVYAIVVFAFFRVLSRNFEARRKENQLICNFISKFDSKKEIYRQRSADVTHVYKKCPSCRAILRLPRRKGKHTTVCPKCNRSFKVTVRK